jgi:hypothetical protein
LAAEIECIECEGTTKGFDGNDCEECKGTGFFKLEQCPRTFVGRAMTEEINMASWAQKGHLPEHGGMLDQPAWFVDMWGCLDQDQNRIEAEIRKRK